MKTQEITKEEREKMERDAKLRRERHDRKYMPSTTWMQGAIFHFLYVRDFLPVRHLYQKPIRFGRRVFSFGGSQVSELTYFGALPIEKPKGGIS